MRRHGRDVLHELVCSLEAESRTFRSIDANVNAIYYAELRYKFETEYKRIKEMAPHREDLIARMEKVIEKIVSEQNNTFKKPTYKGDYTTTITTTWVQTMITTPAYYESPAHQQQVLESTIKPTVRSLFPEENKQKVSVEWHAPDPRSNRVTTTNVINKPIVTPVAAPTAPDPNMENREAAPTAAPTAPTAPNAKEHRIAAPNVTAPGITALGPNQDKEPDKIPHKQITFIDKRAQGAIPRTTTASEFRSDYETQPSTSKRKETSPPDEDYQLPKKSQKIKRSTTTSNVTLIKNRYAALEDIDTMETGEISRNPETTPDDATDSSEDESENNTTTAAQKNRRSQNKNRIPPIVIPGHPNCSHLEYVSTLRTIVNDILIKYTANTTLLFPTNNEDANKLKNYMQQQNIPHHTYTSKEQQKHAFVLRGLDADIEMDDITNELQQKHKLIIHNIYKMRTQYRNLYLIIMDNTVTLKYLQSKVKSICYAQVAWERRRNERRITQCRRCQAWGHAAANCHRPYKCVKCAQEHPTYQCKKSREEPAICANCRGSHPACSIQCPIYLQKLELLHQAEAAKRPTTTQPPPSTPNAWRRGPPRITSEQHQPPAKQRTYASAGSEPLGARSIPAENSDTSVPQTTDLDTLKSFLTEIIKNINIKEIIKIIFDIIKTELLNK